MSSALLSSGVSPFVAGSFSRPLKGLTPTVVSCTISCTHPPWSILLAIMTIPWSLNSDKLQQLFLLIIKALLNITIIAVLTKSHKFNHPERRRGRRKLFTPTTPNTNNKINPTAIRNPQNSNNKNSHKITSTENHNTKFTNQTTTKTNDDETQRERERERERERKCVLHVAHVYLTMWQQVLPFFVIDLITSKQ
jgi:hypothetical protein